MAIELEEGTVSWTHRWFVTWQGCSPLKTIQNCAQFHSGTLGHTTPWTAGGFTQFSCFMQSVEHGNAVQLNNVQCMYKCLLLFLPTFQIIKAQLCWNPEQLPQQNLSPFDNDLHCIAATLLHYFTASFSCIILLQYYCTTVSLLISDYTDRCTCSVEQGQIKCDVYASPQASPAKYVHEVKKMNVILHICFSLSLNDTDEKECSREAVSHVSGSTISPSTFLSTAPPHPPQYHWLFTSKIEKGLCKAWSISISLTFHYKIRKRFMLTMVQRWRHNSIVGTYLSIISAYHDYHLSASAETSITLLLHSPSISSCFCIATPSTCDSNIGLHSLLVLFPARERSIKSITKLKLAAVTKRNAFAMFGFRWFSCNLLEWHATIIIIITMMIIIITMMINITTVIIIKISLCVDTDDVCGELLLFTQSLSKAASPLHSRV